jgi:hypothetical protein
MRMVHRLRVFENRVLRSLFGSKRDKVTGLSRRLYNKELNDMYSSLHINQVIKSRRRWTGHIASMWEA